MLLNVTRLAGGELFQINDEKTPLDVQTLEATLVKLCSWEPKKAIDWMGFIEEGKTASVEVKASDEVVVEMYEVSHAPTGVGVRPHRKMVNRYVFHEVAPEDVSVGLKPKTLAGKRGWREVLSFE